MSILLAVPRAAPARRGLLMLGIGPGAVVVISAQQVLPGIRSLLAQPEARP